MKIQLICKVLLKYFPQIFEYYFDEELVVAIKKTVHYYDIEVCDRETGCKNLHKIENCNSAVAEFLELLASEEGRPDKFSIATVGWFVELAKGFTMHCSHICFQTSLDRL